MAEIPNIRIGGDVTVHVTLSDSGVKVSWSDLERVQAFFYSELRRAIAGPCTVKVNANDSYILDCLYEAGKPQYTGVQKLIVRGQYHGRHKTYDVVVCNFVTSTEEATGITTIEDPELTVALEVNEVSTTVLENAISEALDAASDARDAAAEARTYSEIERQAAEKERVKAEQERQEAEAQRKVDTAEAISKVDSAVLAADTAAKDANAAATVANTAADKADKAAEGVEKMQSGLFAIAFEEGEFSVVTNAESTAFQSGEITEDGEIVLTFNC